jgi:hypothetical protein
MAQLENRVQIPTTNCTAADSYPKGWYLALLSCSFRSKESGNLSRPFKFAFQATTATSCDGSMESSTSGRVELPAAFEEAHIDKLAQLIGMSSKALSHNMFNGYIIKGDMLERLMAHNDQIPLLP